MFSMFGPIGAALNGVHRSDNVGQQRDISGVLRHFPTDILRPEGSVLRNQGCHKICMKSFIFLPNS